MSDVGGFEDLYVEAMIEQEDERINGGGDMMDREALAASIDAEKSRRYATHPVILAAARERLTQLEGNDLVIPRDVDGNWPMALLDLIKERADTNPWVVQSAIESWLEGIE